MHYNLFDREVVYPLLSMSVFASPSNVCNFIQSEASKQTQSLLKYENALNKELSFLILTKMVIQLINWYNKIHWHVIPNVCDLWERFKIKYPK